MYREGEEDAWAIFYCDFKPWFEFHDSLGCYEKQQLIAVNGAIQNQSKDCFPTLDFVRRLQWSENDTALLLSVTSGLLAVELLRVWSLPKPRTSESLLRANYQLFLLLFIADLEEFSHQTNVRD